MGVEKEAREEAALREGRWDDGNGGNGVLVTGRIWNVESKLFAPRLVQEDIFVIGTLKMD